MSEQLKKTYWLKGYFLAALGFVVVKVHKYLFSWWAEPLEDRRRARAFQQDIQDKLSFLFTEHSARIIPNQGPKPNRSHDFDMPAVVTIATNDLLFCFDCTRWRGEVSLGVSVAPVGSPRDWYRLASALWAVGATDSPYTDPWTSLDSLADLLRARIDLLKDAFSEAHLADTRQKLWSLAIHGSSAMK
jgi:hypothetical protein